VIRGSYNAPRLVIPKNIFDLKYGGRGANSIRGIPNFLGRIIGCNGGWGRDR